MSKAMSRQLENRRILCIDSSDGSAVALVEPGQLSQPVLARAEHPDSRRHAEHLSLLVDQVVAEAGFSSLAQAQLGLIVVGQGPAPFTGLRAGLVTARVLGRVLGVPVFGIPSLEVLARQTLDLLEPGKEVFVFTDARRKEVYVGGYRDAGANDVDCLFGPQVGSASEFANRVASPGVVVCGPGAHKYADILCPQGDFPTKLEVAVMARIAQARLAGVDLDGLDSAETTKALYLRRPDVQMPGKK